MKGLENTYDDNIKIDFSDMFTTICDNVVKNVSSSGRKFCRVEHMSFNTTVLVYYSMISVL